MIYSDDITLITGETVVTDYTNPSTTLSTETHVYHIPFFGIVLITWISLFLAARVVIEFLKHWRNSE